MRLGASWQSGSFAPPIAACVCAFSSTISVPVTAMTLLLRSTLIPIYKCVYSIRLPADPGPVSKQILVGDYKAALHAKAIVFDRKDIFIGSFNLDPRSGDINTEAGIYVESPQLAAELIDFMDNGVDPQNSYRVLLDEEGKLYW